MSKVTASELNLLRSRPQETTLWLSVYKPSTILACQVNDGAAAPGLRLITYNNVTEGDYSRVQSGMIMYVGTSSGSRDVGRVRVRSATSTVITVAENSDINWANDLYLTIVNFWEIDAIYPRVTSTGTSTFWYKDYDIEYTDQNDLLGTFICMGSHFAGFIDPNTGNCPVYYSATGTSSLLSADPLVYDWWMDGATVTGSSSLIPGYHYYNTPGHYTTRLTVTDNNGVVDKSYRHISIYNRPESGNSPPILNWELISLDGSRDAGGYQGRIKVRQDTSDIVDGALVVIFADDKYGGTEQSIGGNSINRQKIVFIGYILDGSISYNYAESSIEFSVGSPSEVMKLTEGFGVALNSSVDPSAQAVSDEDIPSGWVLLLDMDCRRALYHYLRWHSTVLMTNDFQFIGTDKSIQFFDADRESVYDAINNLMNGTLYGNVVCDRQGKIWAEVSIAATNNATGTFVNTFDIQKQDWMNSPNIEEIYNESVSYLEMGGISFTLASGTSSAYLSCAPGTAPSYRGSVQKFEGLALLSQNDLNTLCGNVFSYLNSRYAHVSIDLSGNYRNFDIAPQEINSLTVELGDTPRGIAWNKKAFHVTEISWQYDGRNGTFLPSITLHEVTQGFPATTIVIPPIPPTTDTGGGGFDIPDIVIPPITFIGWLYIYHNGTFVALVSGLNFVDSA